MLDLNFSKKENIPITVVDTGISNLGSLLLALDRIGIECNVTCCPKVVSEAGGLILPGVGAFADGMDALARHGLIEPIRSHAARGRPLLGICLGMQLLADSSEEFGNHQGLGIIPGRVRRLPSSARLRIPNVGWCNICIKNNARLFADLEVDPSFYFVHSYVMECDDAVDSVGTIEFGNQRVTVACQRGSVFGSQFHPEKSQDSGLTFLANFSNLVNSL